VTQSRRRSVTRDERGATGLVELMVATALALILLAMISQIGALTERSVKVDQGLYGAETSALHTFSSAVDRLGSAAPLGTCSSPAGEVLLSKCHKVTETGPVLDAAVSAGSDPTAPNGMCYYAYDQSVSGLVVPGLVAPTLTCAVDYPADGDIYVITYAPSPTPTTTYTSCEANTCFGGEAPDPGYLPPEPTTTNCTADDRCAAVLAAVVEGNQAGFHFFTETGPVHGLDEGEPATSLAGISRVVADVTVSAGAYGQTASYNYTFTASVSTAAYRQAQSWESGQGGAGTSGTT